MDRVALCAGNLDCLLQMMQPDQCPSGVAIRTLGSEHSDASCSLGDGGGGGGDVICAIACICDLPYCLYYPIWELVGLPDFDWERK